MITTSTAGKNFKATPIIVEASETNRFATLQENKKRPTGDHPSDQPTRPTTDYHKGKWFIHASACIAKQAGIFQK